MYGHFRRDVGRSIDESIKKTSNARLFTLVRMTGLEPARLTAYAPKAYVYTNFTTSADILKYDSLPLFRTFARGTYVYTIYLRSRSHHIRRYFQERHAPPLCLEMNLRPQLLPLKLGPRPRLYREMLTWCILSNY